MKESWPTVWYERIDVVLGVLNQHAHIPRSCGPIYPRRAARRRHVHVGLGKQGELGPPTRAW